jgi:hypothetical protein
VEGDEFFVVVPSSYGADRDRYAIVANALCQPRKLCGVAFWFEEAKVPTTVGFWVDWPDEQANAQAAGYSFNPKYTDMNGVTLGCWLNPRRPCIVPQRNGVRVSSE